MTAPLLAERFGWLMARGIDGRAVVVTMLAAGIVTARQPLAAFTRLEAGDRAVSATRVLPPHFAQVARNAGLHGPVFNSMNLGGFIAWELYPEAQIYQDTRLQAVPSQHFLSILKASRSVEEWEAMVRGIDWAVISLPRPNQLSGAGHFQEPAWITVFEDAAVRIVVRRGSKLDSAGH